MFFQNMRRYWLAVHLYLGLSFGFFFSLAGLTGSFLAFYPEIDRAINPQLVVEKFNHEDYQFQAVVDLLNKNFPSYTKSWRIEVPLESDRSVTARYYEPPGKESEHFAPLMVSINPNTLQVITGRYWGEYFVTWIYDLHYSLLVGKIGKTLMSVMAIFYLFMLFIGVYLWLPKKAAILQKMKFQLRPHWVRKIYDIHTLVGVYALTFLLILIVTGIVLATPKWITPLIDKASTRFQKPVISSVMIEGKRRVTVDQAIQIAKEVMPNSPLRWIETPDGESGVYAIRLKQLFEPGDRFPKTMVWIDQYSGAVLAVRNPLNNSYGDIFLDLQHPLHSGEILGFWGRLLVLIMGLMPTVLFLSGIIRWRQKVKARKVAI